jgi:hypothetical protein
VKRTVFALVALVVVAVTTSCSVSVTATAPRDSAAALKSAARPAANESPTTDQVPSAAALSCAPGLAAAGPASPTTADPIDLTGRNRLAALPVSGLPERTITNSRRLRTPEDYLAGAMLSDQAARLAALYRDGFEEGIDVDYASGPDRYGAIVMRFASPAAALDYLRVHVAAICGNSWEVLPIGGLVGVAYLRDDGLAKAVFVAGDAEIQLDVCTCVETQDRVGLAGAWATDILEQLGVSSLDIPTGGGLT